MLESYYYRVDIFCTTFGKDPGEIKPFTHSELFQGENLKECRSRAVEYYSEKIRGIDTASFVFPFEDPEKFVYGKHSAISIELFLVEVSGGEENLYSLSESEEVEETFELEQYVFGQLGIKNF